MCRIVNDKIVSTDVVFSNSNNFCDTLTVMQPSRSLHLKTAIRSFWEMSKGDMNTIGSLYPLHGAGEELVVPMCIKIR